MPKVNIEQKHALTDEQVKERLRSLGDRLGSKYGVTSNWVTPTQANLKAVGVSGVIAMSPGLVRVTLDLSFALTPIRGKMEDRITRELRELLG